MVYWTVTLTITPGKDGEVIQWFKKLAHYNREQFGTDMELCELMDGEGGRYIWLERYQSLAAWEEDDHRFQADATAKTILGEAAGLFTASDVHFWRTIDLTD